MRQNIFACFVVLVALAAAAFAGFRHDKLTPALSPGETCYIVYWDEDDFARHLLAAADHRHATERVHSRIKVVPVAEVTGPDGGIRYPVNSHSIQIRPLPPSAASEQRRLIWYWYDGGDPGALLPYAQWFWREARRFEAEQSGRQSAAWEEETSSLRPELVIPGFEQRPFTLSSLLEPRRTEIALLWLLVFFIAGHLHVLSLAEVHTARVLPSLVVTPAGWRQVAIAKQLFHATLAVVVAVTATLLLKPAAVAHVMFWQSLATAVVFYLSVGQALGAVAKNMSAASIGGIAYVGAAGVWLAVVWIVVVPVWGEGAVLASPEGTILAGFDAVWSTVETEGSADTAAWLRKEGSLESHWLILAGWLWAIVGQTVGRICYRRLRAQ